MIMVDRPPLGASTWIVDPTNSTPTALLIDKRKVAIAVNPVSRQSAPVVVMLPTLALRIGWLAAFRLSAGLTSVKILDPRHAVPSSAVVVPSTKTPSANGSSTEIAFTRLDNAPEVTASLTRRIVLATQTLSQVDIKAVIHIATALTRAGSLRRATPRQRAYVLRPPTIIPALPTNSARAVAREVLRRPGVATTERLGHVSTPLTSGR